MPYRKLYRRRQSIAQERLNLQWYVDDALELSWVEGVGVKSIPAMPATHLLGFIVKHNVGMLGGLRDNYTIAVAGGISLGLERFVVLKELMHCYFVEDDPSATFNAILLESLLKSMFGESTSSQSMQVKAEFKAFWMALGVICPETTRLAYKAKQAAGMPVAQIAASLGIEPYHAMMLLDAQYDIEIAALIN